MWNRFSRQIITDPSDQITSIAQRLFPHWILKVVTDSAARNSTTQMPKFDGFQICRFFTRRTYLDVIAIIAHNAYGQNAGERRRIPTLMPVIYALATFGHLPTTNFPRINSVAMLTPI